NPSISSSSAMLRRIGAWSSMIKIFFGFIRLRAVINTEWQPDRHPTRVGYLFSGPRLWRSPAAALPNDEGLDTSHIVFLTLLLRLGFAPAALRRSRNDRVSTGRFRPKSDT